MIAAYYDTFKSPIRIDKFPDPAPESDEVIIKVKATGICRSDWHGWQGHDSDIQLPHVPGHELAGEVAAIGKNVTKWKEQDRVTVPFCVGCGRCDQCMKGQEQICDHYFQPGFTGWGSFAEFVRIKYADHNLVQLPDDLSYTTAASLGCRFITAWRGVVAQGKIHAGDWIAIHGCGGVGLSAIMIAVAFGALPIAVDIDDQKLTLAKQLGAIHAINARDSGPVWQQIKTITKGGAAVSIDALGSRETCSNSILSLKKQGRHIQLGLLAGGEANPSVPMSAVIANELEIIGSHGMQAHQYPRMLDMISNGSLKPEELIGKIVNLEEGVNLLMEMNTFKGTGISVIQFD